MLDWLFGSACTFAVSAPAIAGIPIVSMSDALIAPLTCALPSEATEIFAMNTGISIGGEAPNTNESLVLAGAASDGGAGEAKALDAIDPSRSAGAFDVSIVKASVPSN